MEDEVLSTFELPGPPADHLLHADGDFLWRAARTFDPAGKKTCITGLSLQSRMKGSPSQCKLSQHCQMWLEQSVFPVHLRSRSGIVAPQTLAALSPLIACRLADIQGKAFMFLCCPASLGASLLTVMWYFCSALLRHEGCHCDGGGLVSVGALFLWTVEAFQFVLACDPAPFLPKLTSLMDHLESLHHL